VLGVITGAPTAGRLRAMAWSPMSREEAEAVLAEEQPIGRVVSVERGALEYEARLVTQGKPASEIYERLTDFLGYRPDATEAEKT
jgi:hypothetical protein